MNVAKLKDAERDFMNRYPGGFQNPEMVEIGKKHKVDKMQSLVHELFDEKGFSRPDLLVENAVKIITRSSLISVFEKPKFRDLVRSFNSSQQEQMTEALFQMLHGDQSAGFQALLEMLIPYKMAKWTLMTVIPVYYRLQDEVFIKPTTTKGILKSLEIDEIQYNPRPSWDFYSRYRELIGEMKGYVDPMLSPNNPAFTGFLMNCIL